MDCPVPQLETPETLSVCCFCSFRISFDRYLLSDGDPEAAPDKHCLFFLAFRAFPCEADHCVGSSSQTVQDVTVATLLLVLQSA